MSGIDETALVSLAESQLAASYPDPAPSENLLETKKADIRAFLERFARNGGRLAIITSGGTTVPIERKTVRFIDNFSTGMRGARLAEFFLDQPEYSVLFLHRTGSAFPYLHRLVSGDPMRSLHNLTTFNTILSGSVFEKSRFQSISFTQVFEYILLLRHALISVSHTPIGRRCFVCLAAAVSDFYVPLEDMPEGKIQSRENGCDDISLRLRNVPKALELVKKRWSPTACVLAFKLETDQRRLVEKSMDSFRVNGVDAVLANDLHTRYVQVQLFSDSGRSVETLIRDSETEELEAAKIGPALVQLHEKYIAES